MTAGRTALFDLLTATAAIMLAGCVLPSYHHKVVQKAADDQAACTAQLDAEKTRVDELTQELAAKDARLRRFNQLDEHGALRSLSDAKIDWKKGDRR